jgi:predicted nucleic acid-binding protein
VTSFFDTNLLVYLFDSSSPEKQRRAREVLSERAQRDQVLLSAQVLEEFYVAVTRKLATPLSGDQAERLVRDFAAFPVVGLDGPLVIAAVVLSRRHKLSLWDALIVVAAKAGGATELLTEDLQHGQTLEGVRIVNPFLRSSA